MQKINITVDIQVPFVHPDKFSELIGLRRSIVQGWLNSGYLPTVKRGKYTLVNLSQLSLDCLKGELPKKYSELENNFYLEGAE